MKAAVNKPKKALGQHFLRDRTVLSTIIKAAGIKKTDSIIEIGSGKGILTEELVKYAHSVTAIDIDRDLCELLTHTLCDHQNLTIIASDALQVPFGDSDYKIVANIPYQITAPLLKKIFIDERTPLSLTLLIQKDVADKICMNDAKGNRLGIFVGMFGKPRIVRTVRPGSFYPPPKVLSSVLHIECFSEPLCGHDHLKTILTLTSCAFSGKRKMLRNTIGALPHGMDILEKASIAPERRPENLSLSEWISLSTMG